MEMDYDKKEMKKRGLIKALEKKYGSSKEGRVTDILEKQGSKGLPKRYMKKKEDK